MSIALARVRVAGASHRDVQTLARSSVDRRVRDIVGLYLNPPAHAAVFCVDEKPQIQALDRTQPLLPMQPGQVERRTHDYTRHGTTTLTAGLNVVTGMIVCPTLEATRTEPEFVAHIARTVDTDADAEWIFVVDRLNTHQSESLVKFVAERCGLPDALGKKATAVS